jgi:hypothetical protein
MTKLHIWLSFKHMGEADTQTVLSWFTGANTNETDAFSKDMMGALEDAIRDVCQQYMGELADYPHVDGWQCDQAKGTASHDRRN